MRSLAEAVFAKEHLFADGATVYEQICAATATAGLEVTWTSLQEAFDLLYRRLRLLYPSEFFLKNELLNRIFLTRHNPLEATVLTEMRVGKKRVDLVVVNGTTTAYEIKSRFDSLVRVRAQTDTYLTVFERVYVVCDQQKVREALEITRPEVGVMVVVADGGFRYARKATPSPFLDRGAMLTCMRKPEYQAVTLRRFGALPQVPNMQERSTYLKMFESLPIRSLHREFVRVLRDRGAHPGDGEAMNALPYAMRIRYYELSKKERDRLIQWV